MILSVSTLDYVLCLGSLKTDWMLHFPFLIYSLTWVYTCIQWDSANGKCIINNRRDDVYNFHLVMKTLINLSLSWIMQAKTVYGALHGLQVIFVSNDNQH